MPEVSVVIPAYNAEQFIKETIISVLKQTFVDYEIVLVDDGSTDKTKQIIDNYTKKTRYIYQDNQGVSAARNIGIRQAKGNYMAFLDSDDVWFPIKLEKQMEVLKSNPEVDIIGCDAELINEHGKSLNKFYSQGKNYDFLSHEMFRQLSKKDFIPISSVIVKKHVMDELKGFNELLKIGQCEDYDFLLRAAKKYKIFFLNEVLMQYRISPNNMSANLERRHRNIIKIMDKYVRPEDFDFSIRRKYSLTYYGLGYALFEKNNFQAAREEFLRSIYFEPFTKIKKYFLWLASYCPVNFINQCRKLKRKIAK